MCQENYSLKNDGTKQPRSNRGWTIITNFSAECCFSEYASISFVNTEMVP